VVVRFVDIGGIVHHHCLVDSGGIVHHHCLVDSGGIVHHHCLVDIGGIVHHHCLNNLFINVNINMDSTKSRICECFCENTF
jgi:hypothetical protein